MAGFWGSHMGLVDLLLEKDGGNWRIVDFTTEARPIYHRDADRKIVADVEDKPDVIAAASEEHEATPAYVRRPVGQPSAPLYSFFALFAADPSVQFVPNSHTCYIQETTRKHIR